MDILSALRNIPDGNRLTLTFVRALAGCMFMAYLLKRGVEPHEVL